MARFKEDLLRLLLFVLWLLLLFLLLFLQLLLLVAAAVVPAVAAVVAAVAVVLVFHQGARRAFKNHEDHVNRPVSRPEGPRHGSRGLVPRSRCPEMRGPS